METSDKQEILEAINTFATLVDKQFLYIKEDVAELKEDVGVLKQDVGGLKEDVGVIKQDVGGLKNQMVTKDYLDDKLSDLRGDLVVLVRKEDRKFGALIAELLSNNTLSEEAAKRVLAMEPFPQQ